MPSHLRKFAQGYKLEDWVEKKCPLNELFECLHPLAARVDGRDYRDADGPDKILMTLAATILHEEASLEDYVLAVNPPLAFHDLSQPGAMTPVCEAAGIIVVRRYRSAIKGGTWTPTGA